jgi:carbohydrate kinase (thermoresistant glucokinase family)
MIVVLMGVSGSGKSAVGRALAQRTGRRFIDADDHHHPANVAKMASGAPLNDDDRRPWLAALNRLLADHGRAGRDVILACSALKADYRRQLAADITGPIHWVLLDVDEQTLRRRLTDRANHFMPASLLPSQLATLERPTDALIVDATRPVEAIVDEVSRRLGM